jgi:hypothetical protein
VEVYPAELYNRLGVQFTHARRGSKSGKRNQADRANQAAALIGWASANQLTLEPELDRSIQSGFGSSAEGEDRFDAVAGLFGMLDALLHPDRWSEPESERILRFEGWIFGQDTHFNQPAERVNV